MSNIYFDENILRILYSIPMEENISEQLEQYWSNIYEAANNATQVFLRTHEPDNTEFDSDLNSFEDVFKEADAEEMDSLLNSLRENEEFEKLYSSYIDDLNKFLINTAIKNNPELVDDVNLYLAFETASLLKQYSDLFEDDISPTETEETQPTT